MSVRETIEAIIRQAGEIILAAKKPEVFEKDGHANFVTQTDMDAQTFLIDRLHRAFPEAEFLAEEKENEALSDRLTFIIDPIDGTTNFMHGRNWSCIAVALTVEREVRMAFVYQPWEEDMYFAEKGGGAYCNGAPIHVSDIPLDQGLIIFGTSPYNLSLCRRSMALCAAFIQRAVDVRRLGSAELELCDVAAGRAEAFWELELKPWDYAAGSLILTEAGGRVSRTDGQPLRQGEKTGVLAGNPRCFEAALEVMTSVGAD